MIPRKKVLFLLFGEWFVFWNKFVFGDVDEKLFQVEKLDGDGVLEAFEALTRGGGDVVEAQNEDHAADVVVFGLVDEFA